MKKIWIFAFLIPALVWAAENKAPVIHVEITEEEPQVRTTGEFSSMEAPGVSGRKGTPKDSAAWKLAADNQSFRWIPSVQKGSLIGSADFTGAALSPDGSVFVFLERIGGEGQPNSTRIVLINAKSGRLLNAFEKSKRLLTTPCFVPGKSTEIFAVEVAQRIFKTFHAIVKIDLKTGKILRSHPSKGEAVRSFALAGEELFYTADGLNGIAHLKQDLVRKNAKVLPIDLDFPKVCGKGKSMAVYGGNTMEFFTRDTEDEEPDIWIRSGRKLRFPPEIRIRSAELLSEEDQKAIVFSEKGECFFTSGSSFRKIASGTTGKFTFFPAKSTLFLALELREQLAPFTLPELVSGKAFSPGRLKPVSKGGIYAVFPLGSSGKQMLLADEKGNLFLLTGNNRRWKKNPVFQVEVQK